VYVKSSCRFKINKCNQEKSRVNFKNKDLTIEVQGIWNVETNVIPAVTVATGTVSPSFRKYLGDITGKN
jgi:hypothetical protein